MVSIIKLLQIFKNIKKTKKIFSVYRTMFYSGIVITLLLELVSAIIMAIRSENDSIGILSYLEMDVDGFKVNFVYLLTKKRKDDKNMFDNYITTLKWQTTLMVISSIITICISSVMHVAYKYAIPLYFNYLAV